jgi:hypothetical protein
METGNARQLVLRHGSKAAWNTHQRQICTSLQWSNRKFWPADIREFFGPQTMKALDSE